MADHIAVVLGTRPEIIKLGPIISLLGKRASVVHTGQHYDQALSRTFFDAFRIKASPTFVGIGGKSRGAQIGEATVALTTHFETSRPAAVVIQGDTNTAAAAALAANACELPLVHVEAGLRSHDRRMPEEHNRIIADHLADLCLAPTSVSARNLRDEGIPDDRIAITGNTVVDALGRLLPPHEKRLETLERHGLKPGAYVLSTFHRPENVDDPDTLEAIIGELARLDLPVVLPLHPRTLARAAHSRIAVEQGSIKVTAPVGYEEFLSLLAECGVAVSDSGGVQEEVSVLKRPMVVVRRSTERPEVLGTFCRLVKPGPGISACATELVRRHPLPSDELIAIPSPYGEGDAAARTMEAIDRLMAST